MVWIAVIEDHTLPMDISKRPKFPRKIPRRKTSRGIRLTREPVVLYAKRGGSRSDTPMLRWNFNDGIPPNNVDKYSHEVKPNVSSRKIAAGLLRMRLPQAGADADQPHHFQNQKTSSMEVVNKHRDHDSLVDVTTIISSLEEELGESKSRVTKLEMDRRYSKKKLDEFLKEERAMWMSKQQYKVCVILHDMKAELTREKNKYQSLEMVNSKLVNELANVKLSAKCYVHEYEKERKARELIVKAYEELAKEIRDDKAEIEALKHGSIQVQEEVEEERRMLQMTEVWREERVQMKLVDAKVMLEEKYSQMNQLVADLESFLRSKSKTAGSSEIKKARLLKQVAASVKMQDIRDLKYEHSNSD